jgi:LemA protein
MRGFLGGLGVLAVIALIFGLWFETAYNSIQTTDEDTSAQWSEVVNQYQRRSDLIPNIVNTTKAAAQQEKDIFVGVAEARSKVGQINISADHIPDAATMQKYQEAQGQLTNALSKLMSIQEAYPQLKSDAIFRDTMRELEGTENRIATARNRYIKSVQAYNVGIRSFPGNLVASHYSYERKPNFSVENEKAISVAPKADFGNSPTPSPAK